MSEGAQSFIIKLDDLTKKVSSIMYTDKTSIKLTDENFEGKTLKFAVVPYADKFKDIADAEANGKPGTMSDWLEVTFPVSKGTKPTAVKFGTVTATDAPLNWTAGSSKGKSWLVYASIGTNTDPEKATVHIYTTYKNLTLNEANLGEATAGKHLNVWVKELNKTFKDEADALANGDGEFSDMVSTDFLDDKIGKATDLAAHGTTYNHTTIDFTKPDGFQSAVLYADDVPIAYDEDGRIEVTNDDYAGKTIDFTVVCYKEKFIGVDDTEKMNKAVESGRGGDKSDVLPVEFPPKDSSKK